jgi:hypothetical protein
MTQVALRTHKKDLMSETPNFAKRKFLYRLSRSDYERQWGKDYVKPGVGTRILSTLLRYMPKIGPFKTLAFNTPTPQTEDLYITSINMTFDQYRAFLEEVRTDTLVLPNCDLDSGQATKAAEYSVTDDSYAKLLARLSERKFNQTSREPRDNILEFYSDLSVPIETKKDQVRWQGVLEQLKVLDAGADYGKSEYFLVGQTAETWGTDADAGSLNPNLNKTFCGCAERLSQCETGVHETKYIRDMELASYSVDGWACGYFDLGRHPHLGAKMKLDTAPRLGAGSARPTANNLGCES